MKEELTMAQGEIVRRLNALMPGKGKNFSAHQLRLSDLPEFVGMSFETLRQTTRGLRLMKGSEQDRISRFFGMWDAGKFEKVFDDEAAKWILKRVPGSSELIADRKISCKIDIGPHGPKLTRMEPCK